MTGTLGLFSLTDLFQLLASSARTGRLAVHHPDGLARIYFEKGRVVYADFGGFIGEDAVFELFADERGSFDFQLGLPAPGVTIAGSTESLLMEAIRRLDESRKGLSRLSSTAIPLLSEAGKAQRPLPLSHTEREVLKYVNGQYDLQEIAQLAEAPLEDIKEVVTRLSDAGAIRFAERKVRTARLVVQLARWRLPPGVVALDAQIFANWERALGQAPRQVACRRPDGRVDTFLVQPADQIGPYLLAAHETLFKTDLSANTPLLVKPVLAEP